jgi:hypothetical protein
MKKLMKKLIITKLSTLSISLTLAASLMTGCSSTGKYATTTASDAMAVEDSAASYDSGAGIAMSTYNDYSEAAEYEADDSDSNQSSSQTQDLDSMTLLEEKLVYYCDIDIETLDYEATIASIKDAIKKYGGVIQSEDETDSSYDWYYENYQKTGGTMKNYIEIRVPSANYESFITELDGVGKITSKSTSVDNISQKYYDTTTQIEALQIQEKNLLEMLEKCETIEDMITVEERLSNVQYQLNSLQTTKRYMDTDVAYSYVNINVTEVMEYHYNEEPVKKNTFADRLKNTLKSTGKDFLSFLEGLLFLIIRLFPYLVIIAVICFIFRKKIKHAISNHKAKKEAERARREFRNNMAMQYTAEQQAQLRQQQQYVANNNAAKDSTNTQNDKEV